MQPVKPPLIQETQGEKRHQVIEIVTCMNRWQVIFSQVRLVDHINIHGGGAVDERAPVREKLSSQQSVFTDNINLQTSLHLSNVFYLILKGGCIKKKK